MAIKCFNCENELTPDMRFCPYCGQKLKICDICQKICLLKYTFCANCGNKLSILYGKLSTSLSDSESFNKPPLPASSTENEPLKLNEDIRKHATVLFADIKGSTKLVEGMDPEEARNMILPIVEIMRNSVLKFEGTIVKTAGDGIIAIFGAPYAREDHALRACLAALLMQKNTKIITNEIQIRVGLNSGEIYLEGLEENKYDIAGPNVNLATRMEQTAEPGTIQITKNTLNLVEHEVVTTYLGAKTIKGFSHPIETYKLDDVLKKNLIEAKERFSLLPFIGREAEITLLNHLADQVKKEKGHAVGIIGEAGQGKTRLLYEFIRKKKHRDFGILIGFAYSHTSNAAYSPIIEILRNLMEIMPNEEEENVREKIKPFLENINTLYATQAILSFLEILIEDPDWMALDAPLKRKYMFDVILAILCQESSKKPYIIIIENFLYIDKESESLIEALFSQLDKTHILLIFAARTEYIDHFINRPFYTQIYLSKLPKDIEGIVLDKVLGIHPSLNELKEKLLQASSGNPFFLEEMIKSLIQEKVLIGDMGSYQLSEMSIGSEFHLPESIFALLQTQIDDLLALEKKILHFASVIGEKFSYRLLIRGLDKENYDAIQAGIHNLIENDYIYETQIYPEPQAAFKHALIHEVAYNSLLKSMRRAMHIKILSLLEESPENEQDIQLKAYHAFHGENWQKTFLYCQEAANEALFVLSVNKTAAILFERALIAAEHLPQTKEQIEKNLHIYFYLITIYRRLGYLQQEEKYIKLAEEPSNLIAKEKPDLKNTFILCSNVHAMSRGEIKEGLALIEKLPEQCFNPVLKALFVGIWSMMALWTGDYKKAEEKSEEALHTLPSLNSRYSLFPIPCGQFALWLNAWSKIYSGNYAKDLDQSMKALLKKGNINQCSYPVVYILMAVGCTYYEIEEYQKAAKYLSLALTYAVEVEIIIYVPFCYAMAGCVNLRLNLREEGKKLIDQALLAFNNTQSYLVKIPAYVPITEGLMLLEDYQTAKAFGQEVLESCTKRELLGFEAILLRLIAEIDLHLPNPHFNDIKNKINQALTIANRIGMKNLIKKCHQLLNVIAQI